MRILQVIEFATPFKGGSVGVARLTASGLAQRGHEVELWASSHGRVPPIDGVALRLFRGAAVSGLYFTPGIIAASISELGRFDLIHLHNVRSFQNAVVGTVARRKGIPYILSLHGSIGANGQKALAKSVFDSLAGNRLIHGAAALTTPSELEASAARSLGLDTSRITVTHNPVVISGTPGALQPRTGLPTIGYLGRLDRSKSIDLLLAAFAHACSLRPDLRLDIAGPDDGDEARLRRLTTEAHLDDAVVFRGPLYGEEKWSFLARCHVVASPCPFEVFGLASFEALSQGTPVVVAEGSGGAAPARESGAALWVDPFDPIAFGDALLTQLDVAVAAREHAQRFVRETLSLDRYLDEIESLYERASSPDHSPDSDEAGVGDLPALQRTTKAP